MADLLWENTKMVREPMLSAVLDVRGMTGQKRSRANDCDNDPRRLVRSKTTRRFYYSF